jgi:hypothetical protein
VKYWQERKSCNCADLDGIKGVYHINAFKCVTQWGVVATVQGLSEAFLLPVIAHIGHPQTVRH